MTEVLAPPVGEVLKPCPMSGHTESEDNLMQEAGIACRGVFARSVGHIAFEVQCVCGVHGPRTETASEAIALWNRRPSLAAPTVQVGEDLGSISAQEAEIPTEQTSDASVLWMMHVRGPDDVYPAPDYETAVKWCDYINYRFAPQMPDIITSAVPGIWIYSAEQHAASLAQAIADWTMPLKEDGSEQVVIPKLPVERWMQRAVDAEEMLRDIGDKAHDASTGPEVPDLLWEIRSDAYALLIDADAPTSTSGMRAEGRNEPNPNPHEAERRIALEAALTSLVEAKALKEVRSTVAGWNGEGREEGPFDRHPPRLGASIATNCGAVYDLDEALTKARALLTTKTGE